MNQSYTLLSSPGFMSSGNMYTQSHFSCAQVHGLRNTQEHLGTAPKTVTSLPNRQCPEQGLFFNRLVPAAVRGRSVVPQCGALVTAQSD